MHLSNKNQEERRKTDSDWTESFEKRQVEIISQLVSTLAVFLRKSESGSIWCRSHKHSKNPFKLMRVFKTNFVQCMPIQSYYFQAALI
jgi:hypothetical protein